MNKAISLGVVSAFAIMAVAPRAHAESFFQAEVGIGASHIKDMGDGTWIQRGAPNNKERVDSPAFMAGITGQVYQQGRVDVRYHVDYVYMGEFSASVDGVPDPNYDIVRHRCTVGRVDTARSTATAIFKASRCWRTLGICTMGGA